jgi:hypothetical protein
MPSYDDFFPKNWANNPAVEARHREIDRKIVAWPRDEAGQIDANMLMLMTIIILFNSDFTNLKNRYGAGRVFQIHDILGVDSDPDPRFHASD